MVRGRFLIKTNVRAHRIAKFSNVEMGINGTLPVAIVPASKTIVSITMELRVLQMAPALTVPAIPLKALHPLQKVPPLWTTRFKWEIDRSHLSSLFLIYNHTYL